MGILKNRIVIGLLCLMAIVAVSVLKGPSASGDWLFFGFDGGYDVADVNNRLVESYSEKYRKWMSINATLRNFKDYLIFNPGKSMLVLLAVYDCEKLVTTFGVKCLTVNDEPLIIIFPGEASDSEKYKDLVKVSSANRIQGAIIGVASFTETRGMVVSVLPKLGSADLKSQKSTLQVTPSSPNERAASAPIVIDTSPPNLPELERKAAAGDVQAQSELGQYHRWGLRGNQANYVEAYRWLRLAAEENDAMAQANLADLYADGLGTEKNLDVAYKWIMVFKRNLANNSPEPEKAVASFQKAYDRIGDQLNFVSRFLAARAANKWYDDWEKRHASGVQRPVNSAIKPVEQSFTSPASKQSDLVRDVPKPPVVTAVPTIEAPPASPAAPVAQPVPPTLIRDTQKTIDQTYNERASAECERGGAGLFCREAIKLKLCSGEWSDNPSVGKSLCRQINSPAPAAGAASG